MKNLLTDLLKRCLASLILAMPLGVVSGHAGAVTPVLAVGQSATFSGLSKSGAFTDIFSFTLASAGGISDISTWINVASTRVTGFDVTLSLTGGGPIASDTQTVFNSNVLQSKLEVQNLAAGTYNLAFSGVGSGNLGGRYFSTLTVVAPVAAVTVVPEPESWLMLLAGVFLVGDIARRRLNAAARESAPAIPGSAHSAA